MKETPFLQKLQNEGKLKIKAPNEVLAAAYLEKAQKTLLSAKTLLLQGDFENAISLAYYAMYHSLTALLFRIGIKCENHTAAISLLKAVFGMENTLIRKAKEERIDKQYYVSLSITREETQETISQAEEFLICLREMLARLQNEEILLYRQRAEELLR
ncbi:MAG: HEPN domain-containing protein [Nanoarchaeota archaeon]|nr:HEPN domain-containing protein [Nanoarchaeota archaeon]